MFSDIVSVFTGGAVDTQHGTVTAACHIPVFEINCAERLTVETSSTTAETVCGMLVALELLRQADAFESRIIKSPQT